MFIITKTILRKCHTHAKTQINEKKTTYADVIITFTWYNMIFFSGINAIYDGYNRIVSINELRKNHTNNNNNKHVIDDVVEVVAYTHSGIIRGLILGIVWPVTYVMYANNFYYKHINTIVSNDNDTILP
jgi:hypothetical protein